MLGYVPTLHGTPEGLRKFNQLTPIGWSVEDYYYSYELLTPLESEFVLPHQMWTNFSKVDLITGELISVVL